MNLCVLAVALHDTNSHQQGVNKETHSLMMILIQQISQWLSLSGSLFHHCKDVNVIIHSISEAFLV